jgi:hypothetical protein
MAKNAARDIGVKESRRIFEIARGKAQQELKDRNLADDDFLVLGPCHSR